MFQFGAVMSLASARAHTHHTCATIPHTHKQWQSRPGIRNHVSHYNFIYEQQALCTMHMHHSYIIHIWLCREPPFYLFTFHLKLNNFTAFAMSKLVDYYNFFCFSVLVFPASIIPQFDWICDFSHNFSLSLSLHIRPYRALYPEDIERTCTTLFYTDWIIFL